VNALIGHFACCSNDLGVLVEHHRRRLADANSSRIRSILVRKGCSNFWFDARKAKVDSNNGTMIFSIALYHLGGRVLDGSSYKQPLAHDAIATGIYT